MIWLDFFAQVFVHALAWCLALALVAGAVSAVVLGVLDARERRRVATARAWLASRLGLRP